MATTFPTGITVMTRGVADRIEACDGEDRIVAAYEREGHPEDKIWIITEWDRSATTVLFPDEY